MKRVLSIITVSILIFTSCKKADYKKIFSDPSLYSSTVHELNGVVMGNNFSPVVASRNYAYANIAGYEVIAAGDPAHYQSLAGQLNGLTKVAKPVIGDSIDYPYAALIAFCKVGEAVTFPEGSLKYYTDSLRQMAVAHGMPGDVLELVVGQCMRLVVQTPDGDKDLHLDSVTLDRGPDCGSGVGLVVGH